MFGGLTGLYLTDCRLEWYWEVVADKKRFSG